jgi:hypothetical protein
VQRLEQEILDPDAGHFRYFFMSDQ